MNIRSSAFFDGDRIPKDYTCDGDELIPPLSFTEVPATTESLVLIMDDPDSPTGVWDHWVVFNIPKETREVAEGKRPEGIEGSNTWGRAGYGGPCPGSGQHRYVFKLYALDTVLPLSEGATKQEVEEYMKEHILAEAKLIGIYERL